MVVTKFDKRFSPLRWYFTEPPVYGTDSKPQTNVKVREYDWKQEKWTI